MWAAGQQHLLFFLSICQTLISLAHFFALGRAKKLGQENAREAVFRGLTARRRQTLLP
jgi:hypothetical protein